MAFLEPTEQDTEDDFFRRGDSFSDAPHFLESEIGLDESEYASLTPLQEARRKHFLRLVSGFMGLLAVGQIALFAKTALQSKPALFANIAFVREEPPRSALQVPPRGATPQLSLLARAADSLPDFRASQSPMAQLGTLTKKSIDPTGKRPVPRAAFPVRTSASFLQLPSKPTNYTPPSARFED